MKNLISWCVLAFSVAGAVACSSSDTGSLGNSGNSLTGTTVNGTVAGVTIAAKDALFSVRRGSVFVDIYDLANVCEVATANPGAKKANVGALTLAVKSLLGPAITPGTYHLGAGPDAGVSDVYAALSKFDSQCVDTLPDYFATEGTITIATLSATEATGTFSVTFPGGTFDGSFKASTCNPSASDAGADAGAGKCID